MPTMEFYICDIISILEFCVTAISLCKLIRMSNKVEIP